MDGGITTRQGCDVTTIARAIAWLMTISLIAGCAPRPAAQITSLRPPQSFSQLVETIWNVSESGLILTDEFYTVDNLKRAFGGSNVKLDVGKFDVLIGSYWGEIRGFPAWMPATDSKNVPLRFEKVTMSPDGERKAWIRLSTWAPTGVYLKTIEERFGKSWTEPPFVVPPHPVVRAPPIHPDGDKTIIYSFGDERAGRTASFHFGRTGTLEDMVVEANRPKD